MFLKNDLIGIIDGTDVDLGLTNVTLQSVWKLREGRIPTDVLLNCCDNQLTMIQDLTRAKET
jgi:hypothetical protein